MNPLVEPSAHGVGNGGQRARPGPDSALGRRVQQCRSESMEVADVDRGDTGEEAAAEQDISLAVAKRGFMPLPRR